MSGFLRTIQRTTRRASEATCRAPHYFGRGSKLGVSNPDAKDRLAREAREAARSSMIFVSPHAVHRFQERVSALSYDDARDAILAHAPAPSGALEPANRRSIARSSSSATAPGWSSTA